jgi:hypothetical protein
MLGNVASILFAYFFLYTILIDVTDNFIGKSIVISIITVITLSSFELLKRFLFKQMTVTILNNNNSFEKNLIGFFALAIVCCSFYLSVNGAKTLADKDKTIDTKTINVVESKVKDIETNFKVQTDKLDKQIAFYNSMIVSVHSNSLRTQYNNLIIFTTKQLNSLAEQKNKAIESVKLELNNQSINLKTSSNINVKRFILISTFIEFMILLGVGFEAFYNHKIIVDFEDMVNNNPKLRKYINYSKLLEVIYNNGSIKPESTLPTACQLIRLAKTKELTFTQKQVTDFYGLLKYIGIADKKSATRFVALTDMDTAKVSLKNYYNV